MLLVLLLLGERIGVIIEGGIDEKFKRERGIKKVEDQT